MPEKPQDLYGTFGSVPTQSAGGGGATPLSVRANPEEFGGGIGAAVEQLGNTGTKVGGEALDVATHFAQMATEAKVNDDYANKYVPAAVDLRSKFDSLEGQDKIHGYGDYISSLQGLNKQFITNSKSPYETQLMGALINRHVEGEEEGAKRELVESQKAFAGQSTFGAMNADNTVAANSYNDQSKLDATSDVNKGRAALQVIDQGMDPNSSEGKAAIDQASRSSDADMATKSINRAMSAGDVAGAYKVRQTYGPVLPGDQQLHIDDVLHAAAGVQNGKNAVDALKMGQPLPQGVGVPRVEVQAAVANAAHSSGVDPNEALTFTWLESSMGQNLGKRGDIGQTAKGGDIPTQAQNQIEAMKKAEADAQKGLGRAPQPWETYTTYQQGEAGGPALIKAAESGSAQKAVDILRPFYSTPQKALAAIQDNGGNATMTAGDFTGLVQKKYAAAEARAKSDFSSSTPQPDQDVSASEHLKNFHDQYQANSTSQQPVVAPAAAAVPPPSPQTTKTPGEAILAPHQETGEAVQPAATPRQALMNFDDKAPKLLERINAIPNYETRKYVMDAYTSYRSKLQGASNAYTQTLISKADKMAADPNFNDISQISPDVRSALATDHPETLRELRGLAEANSKYASEVVSKDAVKNSPNYYYNLQRVLQEDGTDNHIANENQLHDLLGRKDGTGISLKDYRDLVGAIPTDQKWKSFMGKSLQQISNANGNIDGQGQQRSIAFYNYADQVRKNNPDLKVQDLVDPQSKNFIGKTMQDYMLPREAQIANHARLLQQDDLKKTVPARQPGESPEQYISRTSMK